MNKLALPVMVLGACLALIGGCGSSPTPKFYVLSPLPRQVVGTEEDLAVGVGPLELPDYLDRPQIVTRSGRNELNLAEFDRWGEPLRENTAQVLAENLAALLPSKKVSVFPWKRSAQVQYQLVAKITRFDRGEGGEAVLAVRWAVLGADGKDLLSRESRYAESPAGDGYAATVAAMERALAQFSREAAGAIIGLKDVPPSAAGGIKD